MSKAFWGAFYETLLGLGFNFFDIRQEARTIEALRVVGVFEGDGDRIVHELTLTAEDIISASE